MRLIEAIGFLGLGVATIISGLIIEPTVRHHAANNLVPMVYNAAVVLLGPGLIGLGAYEISYQIIDLLTS